MNNNTKNKLRIVLFGVSGQLGTDCFASLVEAGYECIGLTRAEVDFTSPQQVSQSINAHQPDIVVNACAYTAVDKAESDQILADQVNHLSVAALASACEAIDALLIHISTDYVFDGSANTPYVETDMVNPLTVYGKTKLLGEQAIQAVSTKYLILRTSWVFGENGNNFVKTMLRLGADRDSLSVVSDQFGRPTYVGHIVDVIKQFIVHYGQQSRVPYGVYHCSSRGEVSWYDFAQSIFKYAYHNQLLPTLIHIEPIPSSQYPTPAPRSRYSVMDTAKLESTLALEIPSWQSGLRSMLSHLKVT